MFISVFLIGIGLVAFYVGLKLNFQRKLIKSFIPVDGKILKIWHDLPKTVGGSPGANQCIYICYEYMVNDTVYKSENFYSSALTKSSAVMMSAESAQKIIEETSRNFTVFYNPNNPEQCFIKVTPALFFWLAWVLGIGFILLGCLLFLSNV